MISTISYDQEQIIQNIISLYIPEGIELDPTYSKGNFYKKIEKPIFRSDICAVGDINLQADASCLPLKNDTIKSIMFDPPFIVGHTKKTSGIMGKRFSSFRYISDLWNWYSLCLKEFSRILTDKGVLVVKCQDTVSSGKQHLSHVHLINEAEKNGFVCEDLFVLLAKTRIKGHNHSNQKHARKFHSYFLIFIKKNK